MINRFSLKQVETKCIFFNVIARLKATTHPSTDARWDTGLRQGVRARQLPLLPPQSSWEEKKTFFFLYRRNQQPPSWRGSESGFLGSTNFQTFRSHPDPTQTGFFRQKVEDLVLPLRMNPNMWGLRVFLSSRKATVCLISLLDSAASRRIAVLRHCI